MTPEELQRQKAKSRQQRFLNQMIHDFNYAPKIAQAILSEAEECLLGTDRKVAPGQMQVILLPRKSRHGQAITEMPTMEVVWTIYDAKVDPQVQKMQGLAGLRRHRLQRLLNEAVQQGAMASQEDIALALQVSVRTIKRDCKYLREQGVTLPTRGNLMQIGRGQTHKVQIVGRWLNGESYDQIATHTHHSVVSVRRYIQAFVRVVQLLEKGFALSEIALVLQMTATLVQQYQQLYACNDTPFQRERLQEQLQRFAQVSATKKKRAL